MHSIAHGATYRLLPHLRQYQWDNFYDAGHIVHEAVHVVQYEQGRNPWDDRCEREAYAVQYVSGFILLTMPEMFHRTEWTDEERANLRRLYIELLQDRNPVPFPPPLGEK